MPGDYLSQWRLERKNECLECIFQVTLWPIVEIRQGTASPDWPVTGAVQAPELLVTGDPDAASSFLSTEAMKITALDRFCLRAGTWHAHCAGRACSLEKESCGYGQESRKNICVPVAGSVIGEAPGTGVQLLLGNKDGRLSR